MPGSRRSTASCPLSVRSEQQPFLMTWNGHFRVILTNVAPDLGDPVESREDRSDERNPMTLSHRWVLVPLCGWRFR